MSPRVTRFAFVAFSLLSGLLLAPSIALAGAIALAWDPSPDAVAGYTIYYGTSQGTYTSSVNSTQTSHTVQGLTNGVRYYFVVKAFNSAGLYSGASNEVNGIPVNHSPAVTNPGNRTVKAGAFSLTITASDPDGDALTFSATGLPSGLSINGSSGAISGTVAVGSYSIVVTASDGALPASTTFTLTVTPNQGPTLQTPPNQSNDPDDVVSLQLVGSDADGDPLTYSATGLPPGLAIASATGRITGTPTIPGTYSVTATVFDGSASASQSFTWTIVGLPFPVPISRWRFDELTGTSAADAYGNRTGTLTNGAAWTAGRFGGAVALDGVNDYVALPTFDVTGATVSMALWVRVASVASNDQRFFSKTLSGIDYLTLGTYGSGVLFRLRAGSTTTWLIGGTLPLNTWTHIAAVYDGAAMRLYINGVQVASVAKTGALTTSATAPVGIGRNPDNGANYLNGALDDVRLFSRALTAAEVATLYTEPLPAPPFTDDPLIPGTTVVRAVHITELRTRINALRATRGLAPIVWSDAVASGGMMRASHIAEMRSALNAVYTSLGLILPQFTDTTLAAGTPIKAAHITQLRDAVKALD